MQVGWDGSQKKNWGEAEAGYIAKAKVHNEVSSRRRWKGWESGIDGLRAVIEELRDDNSDRAGKECLSVVVEGLVF